jgi:hypothetical protein
MKSSPPVWRRLKLSWRASRPEATTSTRGCAPDATPAYRHASIAQKYAWMCCPAPSAPERRTAVSALRVGVPTRYDGGNAMNQSFGWRALAVGITVAMLAGFAAARPAIAWSDDIISSCADDYFATAWKRTATRSANSASRRSSLLVKSPRSISPTCPNHSQRSRRQGGSVYTQ